MKKRVSLLAAFPLFLAIIIVLPAQASAAAVKGRITGDWQLELTSDARQSVSLLSLSKDESGALSGKWLSLYGVTDLTDLKYEDNKLTFKRVTTYRDQETTSIFTGTIEKAVLTGTITSPRGNSTVQGKRMRFVPLAAGVWELNLQDQNPATAKLAFSVGKNGKLTATWQSDSGQDEITNVQFKNSQLTFNRKTTINDKLSESSFQATIKKHKLTGTLKTQQGEISVEATRFGAVLIGKWNLEVASDSGVRTQMLTVRPDLTALYGPIPVEKVNLDENKVSFKTALQIGDRKIETSFTGSIDKRTLTGDLTTSGGTRQVRGIRITPAGAKKAGKTKQTFRKPDVIFVPTPQKVVDRMLQLAQVKKDDVVYDLGCGDGRIVVTAAKTYGCTGVGYDISAKRVKESLVNVQEANVGDLVKIERRDIFTLDLSKASVITLYLLPELNVKLIPQIEKCKPGTRILSHDFDMKGVKPDKIITIKDSEDDYGDHTIYLWTTPLKREDTGATARKQDGLGPLN